MTLMTSDSSNTFTEEQVNFISQSVVNTAQQICGDKLRDVILYGSYARGDYKDWSDMDIMVLADANDMECKQMDKQITENLMDLIYQANLLLSVIVTPYTHFERMKKDYPLYRNVENEGKRLCSPITA
ncbi:MAG: nucleotidyltransferase domain-containing protein [Defluviitaleaceae bacterium]|nr:nucleotidyltransferase domain-containing protein [Defluviitaleaceae bacterium]MCL2261920.1 nucleotidyltransferase domain-containing protein [Defluviitaleaceae bacterium]